MSTIKHVAARAGVSFTTVSHVLNGTRRVSDSARQRVEKAIADLDYAPSAIARALKRSETRMLGVVVPNITNPFFAELTRGIEDYCERSDYSVFLCHGDDDEARQARSLQTLIERRVDGLLLAAPAGDTRALAQRLSAAGVATVVIDRADRGITADVLRLDHRAGARMAVEHLISLGHRRIACISGPAGFAISRERVHGWREALATADIAVDDDWLLEGDFSTAMGHELTRRIIERGAVSAIFASNDLLGMGALRAAAECGIAVPGRLSVIGFDGIELGAYTYPALTTVGYPIRAMGEMAAQILTERIARSGASSREVVVPPRLLLRESTGPALA